MTSMRVDIVDDAHAKFLYTYFVTSTKVRILCVQPRGWA